jgi:hypothetical protein
MMKLKECFKSAILLSKATLEDYLFKCNNRKNPKDFSREKRLSFLDTVYFMLNMVKKSLQVKLNSFFAMILIKDFTFCIYFFNFYHSDYDF